MTHKRPQSMGEEIANSISHGVALLAAVAAYPLLMVHTARHSDTAGVVGVVIFGAAMISLYLASTLYHALWPGKAKRLFHRLDHIAIYLLIAGTYTPLALNVLQGAWGWSILSVVWGLAVIGIVVTAIFGARFSTFSTAIYLLMGWLILIAIKPLWSHISANALVWLVSGGLAYTAGVVFYLIDQRVKYAHFIWHLFVIAGTSCHFATIMKSVT